MPTDDFAALAAALQQALASLDVLAAAAEEKRTAAQEEWRAQSGEINRLQKERCAVLMERAHFGNQCNEHERNRMADAIDAAREKRQSANDDAAAQTHLLALLSLARHHVVQARGIAGQVAERMEMR